MRGLDLPVPRPGWAQTGGQLDVPAVRDRLPAFPPDRAPLVAQLGSPGWGVAPPLRHLAARPGGERPGQPLAVTAAARRARCCPRRRDRPCSRPWRAGRGLRQVGADGRNPVRFRRGTIRRSRAGIHSGLLACHGHQRGGAGNREKGGLRRVPGTRPQEPGKLIGAPEAPPDARSLRHFARGSRPLESAGCGWRGGRRCGSRSTGRAASTRGASHPPGTSAPPRTSPPPTRGRCSRCCAWPTPRSATRTRSTWSMSAPAAASCSGSCLTRPAGTAGWRRGSPPARWRSRPARTGSTRASAGTRRCPRRSPGW